MSLWDGPAGASSVGLPLPSRARTLTPGCRSATSALPRHRHHYPHHFPPSPWVKPHDRDMRYGLGKTKGPRRGMFQFEVTGPVPGRDTPILWPPRLPPWHGEIERRQAAGYVPSDRGPFFFCKREEFRVELFQAQEGKCFWCLQPMSMERRKLTIHGRLKDNASFATFEHKRPRSQGGAFSRENIVLAHGSCNNKRAKRRFPHDEWVKPHDRPQKDKRANLGQGISPVSHCGTREQV